VIGLRQGRRGEKEGETFRQGREPVFRLDDALVWSQERKEETACSRLTILGLVGCREKRGKKNIVFAVTKSPNTTNIAIRMF